MTTTYSDHEHPQYVTLAHLEAFERRMINRIEQRFNEQTRWIVGLILPIYALVIAVILTVSIAAINLQSLILSKLP